ncbi:hypothetical protein CEUSTIGMA_g3399.t1 [Chlamydomonas eustigma]|uniref:Uncharacterized protein n=1 Tax=Chlamydomonas eustigma TaxID=1157962 RepID=A0A250WYU7_9CHLO|nr:hypothetical protein CEUSTIGMA_g3399.t1 [Chlamydomonas eustigma]|eukprot:GAX75956.1 hypothetical protein CEUSTIGMA_g3399.t1 [Chlamydomonas eustigma]
MLRLAIDLLEECDACVDVSHRRLQASLACLDLSVKALSSAPSEIEADTKLWNILLEAALQHMYLSAVQLSALGDLAEADSALKQLGFAARLSNQVWACCRHHASADISPMKSPLTVALQPSCSAKTPAANINPESVPGTKPTSGPGDIQNCSQYQEFECEATFCEPLVFEFGKVLSAKQHLNGPVTEECCTTPIIAENALRAPSVSEGASGHHDSCLLLLSYLITRLHNAFQPTSPFWSEHSYFQEETPYFSYLYDLEEEPCSIVEASIQLLRRQLLLHPSTAAAVSNATRAEWWVHTRAPGHEGHQLHFDVDESKLRKGLSSYKLMHPTISSVLYLSPSPMHNPVSCDGSEQAPLKRRTTSTGEHRGGLQGAPTIILDQVAGSRSLAERAWAAWPKIGNYLVFPGDLLHGVLPDITPSMANQPCCTAQTAPSPSPSQFDQLPGAVSVKICDEGLPTRAIADDGYYTPIGGVLAPVQDSYRTTLMIAWWGEGQGPLHCDQDSMVCHQAGAMVSIADYVSDQCQSGHDVGGMKGPLSSAAQPYYAGTLGPSMRAPKWRQVTTPGFDFEVPLMDNLQWPKLLALSAEELEAYKRVSLTDQETTDLHPAYVHKAVVVQPAWELLRSLDDNISNQPAAEAVSESLIYELTEVQDNAASSEVSRHVAKDCSPSNKVPACSWPQSLLCNQVPVPDLRFFLREVDEFERMYLPSLEK